jgi:hypothetical protein
VLHRLGRDPAGRPQLVLFPFRLDDALFAQLAARVCHRQFELGQLVGRPPVEIATRTISSGWSSGVNGRRSSSTLLIASMLSWSAV